LKQASRGASGTILWYFADPMCSWCWGFAPVISAIREQYRDRLRVALMLGGLRPGATEPVAPQFREELLHHWRDVQERSGQPFLFEGALPEGFVYDTEPASRAVVTMGELKPEATFAYFKAIQGAFYGEQMDVTRGDVLAGLAEGQAVAGPDFLLLFESAAMAHKTRKHFQMARQIGVRGFPTLLMQNGQAHGEPPSLLTDGYRSLAELVPMLEAWLATQRDAGP
jgi:putative protein-disulfide isomerase